MLKPQRSPRCSQVARLALVLTLAPLAGCQHLRSELAVPLVPSGDNSGQPEVRQGSNLSPSGGAPATAATPPKKSTLADALAVRFAQRQARLNAQCEAEAACYAQQCGPQAGLEGDAWRGASVPDKPAKSAARQSLLDDENDQPPGAVPAASPAASRVRAFEGPPEEPPAPPERLMAEVAAMRRPAAASRQLERRTGQATNSTWPDSWPRPEIAVRDAPPVAQTAASQNADFWDRASENPFRERGLASAASLESRADASRPREERAQPLRSHGPATDGPSQLASWAEGPNRAAGRLRSRPYAERLEPWQRHARQRQAIFERREEGGFNPLREGDDAGLTTSENTTTVSSTATSESPWRSPGSWRSTTPTVTMSGPNWEPNPLRAR